MTDVDMLDSMTTVLDNTEESVESTSQVNDNNYSLTLSKDNFVKLSSSLGILQNICNDCDIHEGKIRCRTNDRKNVISMDLTSILDSRNITFSGLKNKLLLLATFNLTVDGSTDNSVLVEANDSNFEFSDSLSRLVMRRPIASYLENVYIEDSEFNDIISSVTEDSVLFNVTISSVEKKRISKLCDVFGSNTVTFEFLNDVCKYSTQTSSKDNVSKTSQSIQLLKDIGTKKTLINNLSFMLDTPSNLDITCYLIGTNYCIFKCNLNYYGIPIELYTKSRIVDINEND
jgi:hypothetical protein